MRPPDKRKWGTFSRNRGTLLILSRRDLKQIRKRGTFIHHTGIRRMHANNYFCNMKQYRSNHQKSISI